MFKSKHSGWTWELRRTPFGGGGGGGILDSVSSALGTDGSGGGALGALASIDPGPAIGSGLASVDKTVNDNIPGGWITVGALAAGGLALAYAPEVMALAESAGMTPNAAAVALGSAPVDVATGATVPLNALDAYMASAGLDAGTFGSTAVAGAAPITAADSLYTPSSTVDSVLNAPNVQVPNLSTGLPSGASNGITAPLTGSGAIPGAGSTTLSGGGLTGALPANVMVGDGTLGTTMGATYMAAAPGQFAVDASGAAIPASSVGVGGYAPATSSSISANDINNARKLAQSLMGNSLAGAAQNMAVGQNGVASAIPGIIRGNQTPFAYTAQQPIRNATTPDLAQLATLLKQV